MTRRDIITNIVLAAVAVAVLAWCSRARAQVMPTLGPVGDIIHEEASAAGFDPWMMRRLATIESGGVCGTSARTGSYHGLFQLSYSEFARGGGTGSIHDCRANARATMVLAREAVTNFRFVYGRDPTPTELYLLHQQGPNGLAEHLRNPGGIAWRNVRPHYDEGEARRRGFANADAYARAAIWGNIPNAEARFGGVEYVTSAQFIEVWRERVEGPRPPAPIPVAARREVQECRMPSGQIGLMTRKP